MATLACLLAIPSGGCAAHEETVTKPDFETHVVLKNVAGQKKFAEFAVSPQGQKVGMAGNTDGTIVRLPVNKTVNLDAERNDPRWDLFADVYTNGGRYFPHMPDWTPFRQSSSESINAIVANCGSDPKTELDKLASKFTTELTKQGVSG